MIQNIAILVNPWSGNGKATRIGNWLKERLMDLELNHELFLGNWPNPLERFSEIWIIGGDGTLNNFVNAYTFCQLPLVIFKGGTGNDFAWKLYGDLSIDKQLALVLKAEPRPVDAASCNERLYMNSLGIGFDGTVLQSINKTRWLGGHLGYWFAVIINIFTFKEFDFTIKAGGKVIANRFLLVIVNNSSRTGGGFMVTPKASLIDGRIDMLLCKPLSVVKRLKYLPVIEKGRHLTLPFIQYSQHKEICIDAKTKIPAQIDGDFFKSSSFQVKILPGKFYFKY